MEAAMREEAQECFALRGARRIMLELHGLEHPASSTGPGRAFTRYDEFTHLATSARGLWLASNSRAVLVARSAFEDPNGPENVVRALLARIAELPGGARQLARMAEVEETSRTPGPLRATWGLVVVCVVVSVIQLFVGRDLHEVAYYSGPLVGAGDLWRVVTANLVHVTPRLPVHLVLNMIAALVFGAVVERALGAARLVCVMGAAGVVGMLACGLMGYPPVVGASGIVAGMVGAYTWLEFYRAEELPAWWRIPRGPLVAVLLVSVVVDWVVPIFAGAAHLGGFAAGALSTWALAGRPAGRRPSPVWVRTAAATLTAVATLAVGQAAAELIRNPDYVERNFSLLFDLLDVTPEELNQSAWLIAVDPDSDEELLRRAVRAAERAVAESDRQLPEILDTLAELHFVLGNSEAALAAIDEAIERAPGASYYAEQRRRFRGERASDDRPVAPLPWLPSRHPIPQWRTDAEPDVTE